MEKLFRYRLEIYGPGISCLIEVVRQRENERHVVAYRFGDPRFSHFDDHFFASFLQSCRVDLRDRCRRYRIFIEFRKNISNFGAEFALDYRFYLRKLYRFDVVGEFFELFCHRSGNDIPSKRHHLSQFYESGAKLLERLPDIFFKVGISRLL